MLRYLENQGSGDVLGHLEMELLGNNEEMGQLRRQDIEELTWKIRVSEEQEACLILLPNYSNLYCHASHHHTVLILTSFISAHGNPGTSLWLMTYVGRSTREL
jgi:hypothetical protein